MDVVLIQTVYAVMMEHVLEREDIVEYILLELI
jgi:hypothetical protein